MLLIVITICIIILLGFLILIRVIIGVLYSLKNNIIKFNTIAALNNEKINACVVWIFTHLTLSINLYNMNDYNKELII